MKKLSLYIFLILMWCNVGFAKPILLECKNDEPLNPKIDTYNYFSLDLEKKKFYYPAYLEVAKGTCELGNCEKLTKLDRKLPFIKENAGHLYLGREWKDERPLFDFFTFNKQNLNLVYYGNLIEWMDGTVVKTLDYYSCNKINKFPF